MYLDDAVAEYRRLGKLALKDTSYNRRIVYNSGTVKAANSTLQQLMALEALFKKQCTKLSLFNCPSPSSLSRDDAFLFRKSLAGKTLSRSDTTIYYPTSPLGFIAKISLCRLDSLKMFVYDDHNKVVDSIPLRPGKYTSLLKSKDDVFLLYRGWLELQSQQIKDAISQTTALLGRRDTGLYIQTYRSDNRKELLSAVAQFKAQQQDIERKVLALTLPDEEMVYHMLQSNYSSGGMQIAYLAAGMGFAYTASHSRGEKEYELSNHLGNVLATVSDRKLRVDDGDGTVAYYNADIVNSTDYYPFGSLIPGRSYNLNNGYRYGFNGKENDNEVKGYGEQVDFGARIYDPRIGRWLSVDPLSAKYAMASPYAFALNNPVMFIDPDGKDVKPSKAFLESPFGTIYQNLYKNSSAYLKIIEKFNKSKTIHLRLEYTSEGVPPYFDAITNTSRTAHRNTPTGPFVSIATKGSVETFDPNKLSVSISNGDATYVYEKTEIGLAEALVHEGLHSYISVNSYNIADLSKGHLLTIKSIQTLINIVV